MKKQFIKFWDKIIILLLGSSGILCGCYKYGCVADEYEIKGVVTDEAKNPIQNIQIVKYRDTIYTNAEGKFTFNGWNSGFRLKIEDIDGEENGGEFETQEITVDFTDADLIKKGKECKTPAKYMKTVNITLEKKNNRYEKVNH